MDMREEIEKEIPCIREYQGIKTLFVDGEPFYMLAGETHNSSSSSLEYMKEKVWPNVRGLHLNTLIVPVMWESFEPEKGVFDDTMVKGLIRQARDEDMHLVFLWFGLWKNGESDYAPYWVKKDVKTYFRAKDETGASLNCISPFCEEAVAADAKAFEKLMGYICDFDRKEHTVAAVQIENEVGILQAARDYCEAAQRCYKSRIPELLEKVYQRQGTWQEVFGEDAGEAMMAWAYASAIETIARRGCAKYPLPVYSNAWLEQYPWRPGTYPSGGPVMKMHWIWKAAAPSLFALAPDIYLPNMVDIMREYTQKENPLFIPEARRDVITASFAVHAITRYHAIGYAPFGIEDIGQPIEEGERLSDQKLNELQISIAAYNPKGTAPYLSAGYEMLGRIRTLYYNYRGTGHFQSFLKEWQEKGTWLRFEKFDFLITYDEEKPGSPMGCGVAVELAEDEFLFFGHGYQFQVCPKLGERAKAGILRLEEGRWCEERWKPQRILNGDEKIYCCVEGFSRDAKITVYKEYVM